MKKLSLLMFAILILGCGNETTVIEEPEPVIEEPPTVVMEPELIDHPQIVGGNVLDGDLDADPDVLNRDGIIIEFAEPLRMYTARIGAAGVLSLHWSPSGVVDGWDSGNQVHLMPTADSLLLEYDTKYWVRVYAQGSACTGAETVIAFRTKPR